MSNLIDQLVNDHRTIEELCERVVLTGDVDALSLLCSELESHDLAETTVIDPLVGVDLPIPRARQIVADSRRERANIAAAIDTLRTAQVHSSGAAATATGRVLDLALHHVLLQESQVFPQIREHCSQELLEELGARLTDAKDSYAKRHGTERRAD